MGEIVIAKPARATVDIYVRGKWVKFPRCHAFTKGGGAGYRGPHQCSFRAYANAHDVPLCKTHLRQWSRA